MANAPIILVPGYWLGAWAWDGVAAALRADGHDVMAITLPGLESVETDRSSVTFADHVDAIARAVDGRQRACGARRAQRVRAPRVMPSATASRTGSRPWSMSTPGRAWRARPRLRGAPSNSRCRRRRPRRGGEPRRAHPRAAETFRGGPYPSRVVSSAGMIELTNDARRDIPSTVICDRVPVGQGPRGRAKHDCAFLAARDRAP